jgi:predicted RND superfamily exporter protein
VPIAIGAGLITLGAVAACRWVRVDSDLVSYFREGSIIRTRMEDLHESLSGILTFYLVVETDDPDRVKSPEVLRQIDALQAFVASRASVDNTVSVADYVKTMHREMNGGETSFWAIPDDRDLIAQYLLMLDGQDLAKYVDYDYSTANVLIRHDRSSSWDLRALLREIDEWVAAHMPRSVRVRYTGESILINNAADSMAWNLVTGLGYTVGVVAVVNGLLFLSVKAGFLSLIPNVLPVAWALGVMGLLGIPLNAGTAMLAAIAVGIAVDDTVHYMCRNNWELNKHNDQERAMFATVSAEGLAIITTSIALAGGFAVLGFSNFVPTAHLGLMSAVVFLVALTTDLTLTPVLMVTTRLVTLWHVVALRMDHDLVETAPLFRGMRQWEARKVVLLGSLETAASGEYVLRTGEVGGDLFMVVTGRLRVVAPDGKSVLAYLDPGEVFGEMGFVDRQRRSADVVAETDAEVLRMDEAALDRVRRRFPFTGLKLLQNVAQILSARLRAKAALSR